MYYDDSEDTSKHFGHAHDFIMLICGCTLLLSVATNFGCNEYLDVWWWVRWCIRSINRSLFKLTDYTLGTIWYCLLVLGGVGGTKAGKLKIWFFYCQWIEARARWKKLVNKKLLVTCKLKKDLGFSTFRRCTATWHCLQYKKDFGANWQKWT